MSQGNRMARANFRPEDGIRCENLYVLGTSLNDLAEELVLLRSVSKEQAENFLSRKLAEGQWEEKRAAYVRTVSSLAAAKQRTDESDRLSAAQGAIADFLLEVGFKEIRENPARTRKEALMTLEMAFNYGYRALGLPAMIKQMPIPASSLPTSPEVGNVANRYQNLSPEEYAQRVKDLEAIASPE